MLANGIPIAVIHTQHSYKPLISNRRLLQQHKLIMPGSNTRPLVLFDTAEQDQPGNPYPVGYRGLMTAIIQQASIDALSGDQEAAAWLGSDICLDYCFALGYEHSNVKQWLKKKKLIQ
jgi:hypothetical protein